MWEKNEINEMLRYVQCGFHWVGTVSKYNNIISFIVMVDLSPTASRNDWTMNKLCSTMHRNTICIIGPKKANHFNPFYPTSNRKLQTHQTLAATSENGMENSLLLFAICWFLSFHLFVAIGLLLLTINKITVCYYGVLYCCSTV